MPEQDTSPRWLLGKLAALQIELEQQYETHLFWQGVMQGQPPSHDVPMVFLLDRPDEPVEKAARLDLGTVSKEVFTGLVHGQLSGSYMRFGKAWDELHDLAALALQSMTEAAKAQPTASVQA